MGYTSKDEKLYLSALYLNGWQKIARPDGIQNPSFGTQINYKPSKNLVLNYSTFLGTDKPDSLNAFRQFHNFYLMYEPTSKFGIIAGLDIGRDKFSPNQVGTWYSPVLIFRQSLNDKTRIAFRGEYYSDPNQIIIATGTTNGFQTYGFSSNLDYDLNEKVKFRVEGKMYHSKDKIFANQNNNYSLSTNMSIKF
ncbi:MAG: hypothetical protein C4K58_06615 [Flavobacteriaceae bacterium]|nr:MAG: hypothetical protein C4K58_06615 [Flavobacteriaceae bacterium]